MFNKDYYQKVFDIDKDLEFVRTDNIEYDLDNPFEKYYDINILLLAIDKYKSGEIDAKYLANWANAYNWIINGGFKSSEGDSVIEEFLIYEIGDWIDALSFFDDSDDFYNLDKYVSLFKSLDRVYHEMDTCTAVYAEYDEYQGMKEITVLIQNDKKKYYVLIDEGLMGIDMPEISVEELENKVQHLAKIGYEKLLYSDDYDKLDD